MPRVGHPKNVSQWHIDYFESKLLKKWPGNFPGGPVVKNLPAKAGDVGSIPGLGRCHMPRSN